MTRPALLVTALLAPTVLALAGCSLFGPPAPPPNPDEAACAREAADAPAVKLLMQKALGNEHFLREHEDELAAARQDATYACLRRRGIVRGGGVERQKPLK